MDTYGITYQAMVAGLTTSYLLAKKVETACKSKFKTLCSVCQVGCCSVNDRGLFNLYVKFDWAPEPFAVIKTLSIICLELDGLHFEIHDPLNYMAYVKMPFSLKPSDIDNALALIRENIPKLTARVSQGMDVVLITI